MFLILYNLYKFLTKEDIDKSLKYRRLFMGDWSVAGRESDSEKDVKEDLKELVKSYYKTVEEEEEDAEAEERRAARSRVTDSFDGDR